MTKSWTCAVKAGEDWCPSLKTVIQRVGVLSYHFCSTQAFSGLDEFICIGGGGQPAWPSLQIQMLISSRNTFINMLRIIFNQIPGHPVKLTHKINHHTIYLSIETGCFHLLAVVSNTAVNRVYKCMNLCFQFFGGIKWYFYPMISYV